MNLFFAIPFLIFLFIAQPSFAKEFKCNWGPYNPEPYIILDKKTSKPESGIIVDICSSIAKELGLKVKMVNTPRKRADQFCLDGTTDIIITANRTWLPTLKDQPWLPVFYKVKHKFVFTEKKKQLAEKDIQDLDNLTIATTLGFNYHEKSLNEKIERGSIKRFDVKSEAEAVKMLVSERLHVAIVEEITSNYFLKKDYSSTLLTYSKKTLNSVDITPVLCGKPDKDSTEKISKIADKLITSGKIKNILNKYR